jgi:hypothetical protein
VMMESFCALACIDWDVSLRTFVLRVGNFELFGVVKFFRVKSWLPDDVVKLILLVDFDVLVAFNNVVVDHNLSSWNWATFFEGENALVLLFNIENVKLPLYFCWVYVLTEVLDVNSVALVKIA